MPEDILWISPKDVRDSTEIKLVKGKTDSVLNLCIKRAMAKIQAFSNVKFTPYEDRKYLDGNDSSVIELPENLISITLVLVDGVNVTDLITNNNKNISSINDVFYSGTSNVIVEGVWGYNPIPEELKMGVFLLSESLALVSNDMDGKKALASPFKIQRFGSFQYEMFSTGGNKKTTGIPEVDMLIKPFTSKANAIFCEVI